MLRVGLTGGLASGKSFVGKTLEEMGCYLLKADELGHRALDPGGTAYGPAVKAFGPQILDSGGRIDRKRLGELVFEDPEKLAVLNSLVHPVVIAAEEAWISQVGRNEPRAICVVEAAILIETGSYKRFDRLILAVCRREQQIDRAMKRDGLGLGQVVMRLARQMPLEEKRKYAHYVIDTSGEKEITVEQVRRLYGELKSLQP